MRDLFQTVFELKKQEIEMTRQQQIMKGSGLYLEALSSTASKNDHVCFLILIFLLFRKFYIIFYLSLLLYNNRLVVMMMDLKDSIVICQMQTNPSLKTQHQMQTIF